jgi:F0F1-type ATP synthase assembly protein I
MSLYLQQKDGRSELQQKLAAELQDKAKKKALETERPDGVRDSAYIQGTKQTTSLAWAWVLIGVAIIGVVIWLLVASAQ